MNNGDRDKKDFTKPELQELLLSDDGLELQALRDIFRFLLEEWERRGVEKRVSDAVVEMRISRFNLDEVLHGKLELSSPEAKAVIDWCRKSVDELL